MAEGKRMGCVCVAMSKLHFLLRISCLSECIHRCNDLGAMVLVQWSRCNGLGAMVSLQWSRCNGLSAMVSVQWSRAPLKTSSKAIDVSQQSLFFL